MVTERYERLRGQPWGVAGCAPVTQELGGGSLVRSPTLSPAAEVRHELKLRRDGVWSIAKTFELGAKAHRERREWPGHADP